MNLTGVITEYNPFHHGHIHHLKKARELTNPDAIIAVMSGNFVQRGEPAILDKYSRTRAALKNGVDLVLELPFPFCIQSAQQFADCSIRILALAKVNSLVFGSESGDLSALQEIARLPIRTDHIKESLAKGESYPSALFLETGALPPNDILAVSYLKALADTKIKPIAILRTNDYLNPSLNKENASALAIRQAVWEKKDVQPYTVMAELLSKQEIHPFAHYYPTLRLLLLNQSRKRLAESFLMDEGIEAFLFDNARHCPTLFEFLNKSVSRRYTRSRIQRILCALLAQIEKEQIKKLVAPQFIRVLGFNDTGRKALKYLKQQEVQIATCFAALPPQYRRLAFQEAVAYSSAFSAKAAQLILERELQGPVIITGP
ncbi:MAG: nucleotidyltransferase family protein [Erysipelotrichaceae bacterium]|jgi:predicted nucleotidyltransferase|nr:nucleotidyltransferase family protein [Erysipelotrichaceae bacterium]